MNKHDKVGERDRSTAWDTSFGRLLVVIVVLSGQSYLVALQQPTKPSWVKKRNTGRRMSYDVAWKSSPSMRRVYIRVDM